MSDVALSLPESLRSDLKDPLGPIYTDTAALLADADGPIVAVGDIVTYHLLEAGHTPALAFVDERTKRTDVDDEIRRAIAGFDRQLAVENPPGTITDGLLAALREGLDDGGTTLVRVDGEEDLAALPAVLAVPEGATVVYGQPDEGMVLVTADEETRATVQDIVERMDGDVDRALSLLA